MDKITNQQHFSEVFMRFGQAPFGSNTDTTPFLDEILFVNEKIPKRVLNCLNKDDVFSLGESYGDPTAGDPLMFDFLRVTTRDGIKKEIEVFNLAILMYTDNCEETRRLFRIINAIKDE